MPRPITAALAAATVLLIVAPGVAAKQVTTMKVCGDERCNRVDPALGQRFHDTGGFAGLPSSKVERGPYFRLTFGVGDGTGRVFDHFSMAYLPGSRTLVHLDIEPPADATVLPARVAVQLDRLTRGLSPLPPGVLELKAREAGTTRPPEVWKPWQEAAAEEDSSPSPLLAGVPAAVVLGLGVLYLRRRRHA